MKDLECTMTQAVRAPAFTILRLIQSALHLARRAFILHCCLSRPSFHLPHPVHQVHSMWYSFRTRPRVSLDSPHSLGLACQHAYPMPTRCQHDCDSNLDPPDPPVRMPASPSLRFAFVPMHARRRSIATVIIFGARRRLHRHRRHRHRRRPERDLTTLLLLLLLLLRTAAAAAGTGVACGAHAPRPRSATSGRERRSRRRDAATVIAAAAARLCVCISRCISRCVSRCISRGSVCVSGISLMDEADLRLICC